MTENYLICGIDASLNSTGICIIDMGGKIVHCESINSYPLVGAPRINYIYERYVALFNSYPAIRYIGFERQVPQQRYNYNAKYILDLAEGFGVLKLSMHHVSLQRELDVYQFTAQDLKIYATENGKATKEDMINSLPKRVLKNISASVIPSSVDDIVDAYYAARKTLSLLKSPTEERIDYRYLSSIVEGESGDA